MTIRHSDENEIVLISTTKCDARCVMRVGREECFDLNTVEVLSPVASRWGREALEIGRDTLGDLPSSLGDTAGIQRAYEVTCIALDES